jgi:hypothetical protein
MIDPGLLLQEITKDLVNLQTDQRSVTKCIEKHLKKQDTETIVEGHNLAIKLQRAFEEVIFMNMLGGKE